jgi:Zn-dependent peptidase ImmA (M78 family)/transcriptional regulator with XRE-family HTH domain
MSERVEVRPELLRWAITRSGKTPDDYAARFPHLGAWMRGESAPTLKQLEAFASATYAPIGFLLLRAPPKESVPIPDFRTIAHRQAKQPSPNLLDTIYICQQRQEWYRDIARIHGSKRLPFVGSVKVGDDVVATARAIRKALGFGLDAQRKAPTWTDALRAFIERADDTGIMVMTNGVFLNNNNRTLDPDEFRGFALVDELAPVIFINGADTKSAQMFTLAHELAHVWIGATAVSNVEADRTPNNDIEKWCNRVAAELLVPMAELDEEYDRDAPQAKEAARLARIYKVSTLVILRRMRDAGGLTREELRRAYEAEVKRLRALEKGSGGNFYATQAARVSKRFARALVLSTLEGQTLYRDAFRLLGFAKVDTFHKLATSLGVT